MLDEVDEDTLPLDEDEVDEDVEDEVELELELDTLPLELEVEDTLPLDDDVDEPPDEDVEETLPLDEEVEEPPLDVEVDPPLLLDVEEITTLPELPPPPKKPPAKNPPPKPPNPPEPPTSSGALPPPELDTTGMGAGGRGTGVPWLVTVITVGLHAVLVSTWRTTFLAISFLRISLRLYAYFSGYLVG